MAKSSEKDSLRLYLRIVSYLRPYIGQILLILALNFLFIIFNTLSIWMVAPFISNLFQNDQPAVHQPIETPSVNQDNTTVFNLNEWLKQKTAELIPRDNRSEALKVLSIIIFFTFFFKNLFAFSEAYVVSFVEQKVIKDLRDEVYHHILYQPLGFFQKFDTGNLISRITNDINSLNVAVNRSFTKIIRDPVVVLIFLALLFSISWQLTLVALLVIPFSGILIYQIGQSLKRKSRRVQERIAEVTTNLQETISGIKIVKAFGMQVRMNRLSSPLSETLGVGIMVSILWFGGQLVLSGRLLSPEDFIRFIVVLFSVMQPIKSLGELNNNIQIALASGKRIFDILDTPIAISDRPGALEKKSFERDAGKTTLVNLLPRFYEVTSGSVKIDGIDIRDIKLNNLRRLMGIVTQEVILFNDTVANNIAYGSKTYSMEEIEWAAKLANAYDFIQQLPEGFQTIVGERGTRLSGGQKQRISIARAILKNPPILIFDEATSSLDSESEQLIQEAIENLMKDRTVFIIAHRLSSVINADRIVLIEYGSILDIGTHEELIERSKQYRRLYRLQFTV